MHKMTEFTPTKHTHRGLIFLNRGFDVFSALPWVNVVVLYACAFWVRSSFGRWPVVYKDSPNLPLLLDLVLSCSMLTCLFGILCFPIVWGIWLVAKLQLKQRENLLFSVAMFASGMLILFLLGRFDPWGFQEWFLD